MSLVVLSGGKQTTQHSVTASYNLAKAHWAEPLPKSAVTITDGAGNIVATLTDKAPTVMFNPPKAVTGLIVKGHGSGFVHIYTQDISGFGG
jgi:hypothetical protein